VSPKVKPAIPAWRPAAEAGISAGNDPDVSPPVVGASERAQTPHHFHGRLAPGKDLVPGGAVCGAGKLWHEEGHCGKTGNGRE